MSVFAIDGSVATAGTGSPDIIYATGPSGEVIHPLAYDEQSQTMWGSRAMESRILYKSTDAGLTWTEVYAFPARLQNPSANVWYDKIYAVQVLPTGTILVSAANSPWDHNGTIYRSTDGGNTFSRARHMDGSDFEYTRGCSYPWAFDANDDYAIAGTYSYKDPDGATDRDVWASTDDGQHWYRVFHIEGKGNADVDAVNTHIHIARIDPDGGCWISVGDHDPGWSHLNQTYGLWHAPAAALTGSLGNAPAQVSDGDNDFGDFTRVYSHATSSNRRIRPVTVLFRNLPTGEKYAYLGEDDMTFSEKKTITRLRYDDGSYDEEVKADYTKPAGTSPSYNGGIFGMAKITDLYWVAAAPDMPFITPAASAAMFYTLDGGETWTRDPDFDVSVRNLVRVAVGGRVWGGRPPYDGIGPGYRPPLRAGFQPEQIEVDEATAVAFKDISGTTGQMMTWDWDFGDGGVDSAQHPLYQYGDDGIYTVSLTVTDSHGDSSTVAGTDLVTIVNADPAIPPLPDQVADEGQVFELNVPFTDGGVLDTHTALIDWGDGESGAALVDETGGAGNISGSHIYQNSGDYSVTVTVTDDDGGTAVSSLNVEVVCSGLPAPLSFEVITAYWASNSDFEQRRLSVDYNLSNPGTFNTYDARIVGSISSSGVIQATAMPVIQGAVAAGTTQTVTLQYFVPPNIEQFITTTYMTASDSCGNTFTYPGNMPGV
jgi:PKD repeat protein